MLCVQQFLRTLLIEFFGVACTAGILYAYWNMMTKKSK